MASNASPGMKTDAGTCWDLLIGKSTGALKVAMQTLTTKLPVLAQTLTNSERRNDAGALCTGFTLQLEILAHNAEISNDVGSVNSTKKKTH